jgi:hypothetical protein
MVTQPPSTWIDPNPPVVVSRRTNVVLTVAGIGLTLVVLAALAGVVIAERGTNFGHHAPGPAPVVLSSSNATVPDAFTVSATMPSLSISPDAVAHIQTATGQLPTSAQRGVRLVSGTHSRLYAGSAEALSCNAAAIANDLVSRPARAQAWAQTFSIQPSQVPEYLNSLTPVTLTTDTWVTSHGYAGLQSTTQQTVLQAGNAVLIDAAGVPRVQCSSGNPLQPPADGNLAALPTTGQPWPGYEAQNVVAVAYSNAPSSFADPVPTTPVSEFELLDLATGGPLPRKAGGTIELGQTSSNALALPDPITANVAPTAPPP